VRLTLTVIIVWREPAELLRRCLVALEGQGADQIVVSRSSEAQFSESLRSAFPHVQWVEHSGAADLPQLQWLALAAVRSDVAAFLEAPSIPGPGWVTAHRAAHRAHPEILACGGPVRPPQSFDAWRLGWHWSDYAAYAPGRPSGLTRDLTDANVSYKAAALRADEALLAKAAWGWRIRRASALPSFYEASAVIDYPCPYPRRMALRQRCSAGRAHVDLQRRGLAGRVLAIVTAPLLPILLAWRGWQSTRSAGHASSYLRALPWILVFHACWTYGELTAPQQR
jgi:hypothetical protein